MKRKVNRTYNSILNVLREYPNGFTASQIFENFERINKRKVKKQTVYSTLSRAVKEGIIEKFKIDPWGYYFYSERKKVLDEREEK
jgi:Fe2+ or Zn2+ uptake regulation protein